MIFRVNIATSPLETHRRFWIFSAAAFAVAFTAFLALGWHVYASRKADSILRAENNKVATETAEFENQRADLSRFFALPENSQLHDRAALINGIIDERSFNWTNMFMDLEKVLPLGVRVINIEPSQVNGQAMVKLTIGALNNDAKLQFLRALEQSDSFSNLQLNNVRAPAQDSHDDEVLLDLTVVYSKA
jgi:Tfp pilus assembly protein PilN